MRKNFCASMVFLILTGCATIRPFQEHLNRYKQSKEENDRLYQISRAIDTWGVADGTSALSLAYLERARLYIKDENFNGARTDMMRAIGLEAQVEPSVKAEQYYCYAVALLNLNEINSADENLEQAIRWDPKDYRFYLKKAEILRLRGAAALAMAYVNQALKIQPDNMEVRSLRVELQIDQGRFDTALGELQAADFPEKNRLYLEAKIFWGKGQPDQSMQRLEKLKSIENGLPEYFLLSGLIAESKGDIDKAGEEFRKSLDIDNRSAGALYLLGKFHFQKAEYDKCMLYLNEALKYPRKWYGFAGPAQVWLYLGMAAERKGLYQDAIRFLTQAIAAGFSDSSSDYHRAFKTRAAAYLGVGDAENYKKDMDKSGQYQ